MVSWKQQQQLLQIWAAPAPAGMHMCMLLYKSRLCTLLCVSGTRRLPSRLLRTKMCLPTAPALTRIHAHTPDVTAHKSNREKAMLSSV